MLIGNVFEEIHDSSATKSCAEHLADEVRNIWLYKNEQGVCEWEEGFSEKSDVMHLLRSEGFTGLDSMDYVFRWWGDRDDEGPAGQIEVIWKIGDAGQEGSVTYYKTWIRLSGRDFAMGPDKNETVKRKRFRSEVIEAFEIWKENFPKKS